MAYQKRITMQPINKCPHRSPMAVSEAIQDIVKDKLVCELGCAEGDNLMFMARFCERAFGLDNSRHQQAIDRGLDVCYGDYRKDPIPFADVYYFWPDDGEKDNEFLVNKIISQGNKCTIVVAGDTGYPKEIPSVKRCAENNNGELRRVPFDEGEGHRENGIFLLAIIEVENV